jgi:hypothetical protein
MAHPSRELVQALRVTAARLGAGAAYKWSDFSCCNCGHLVQSVTQLSAREVYEAAFLRGGDWGEQAREFCPSSGYPIDFVLSRLFALGLSAEDVQHLERLSDDRVLREVSLTARPAEWSDSPSPAALRYTRREDVVLYLEAWARLLEQKLGIAEPSEPRLAAAAE